MNGRMLSPARGRPRRIIAAAMHTIMIPIVTFMASSDPLEINRCYVAESMAGRLGFAK
jgi:hypothetical protein